MGLRPHKTRDNRCARESRRGVFDRIVAALAAKRRPPERFWGVRAELKVHGRAASQRANRSPRRRIARRYDRRARPLLAAITLAATVIFRRGE